MSTVTPPSPPPPPPPLAALPRTIVVEAPLALTDLPSGTKLDVIVSQILDTTQLKLKSSFGDVTIKLSTLPNIKTGDALILQLLGSGTASRAQLLTPSGLPLTLAQNAPPGLSGNTNATNTPVTSTVSEPVIARPGAIITANLLRPISTNGTLLVIPQTTPPTSGVNSAVSQAQPPLPTSTASSAVPNPGTTNTSANAQGAVTTATGTTSSTPQVFPSGSQLALKIISINVPETTPTTLTPPPTSTSVSLAPGASLSGVVSGRQGVSQTVVQTQVGPVSLPTTEALSKGTDIKFEVISLKPSATGGALHAAQISGAAPLLDGDWDALDEALGVLRDAAPGAHTHIMQTALPRSDSQLSTNILFFLSALRGGDMKNWLGDGPSRILDRQRPELAARLRTDMNQMTRNVEDPLSGDWRLHGVPFLFGGEIDRLQLLIRDQEDDENEEGPNKGDTRFVIDLNLTNLGHLQIDGLVGNKNKRLDVVLRTDAPLQTFMREDIRKLYTDALDLTGLEGSVGFQAAPGNFVDIPKSGPTVTVPDGGMVI